VIRDTGMRGYGANVQEDNVGVKIKPLMWNPRIPLIMFTAIAVPTPQGAQEGVHKGRA